MPVLVVLATGVSDGRGGAEARQCIDMGIGIVACQAILVYPKDPVCTKVRQ